MRDATETDLFENPAEGEKSKFSRRTATRLSDTALAQIEIIRKGLAENGQLGRIRNISEAGVLFESTVPFQKSASARIVFAALKETVEINGQIVRCEKLQENDTDVYLIGFQFCSSTIENFAKLKKYLKTEMKAFFQTMD